MLLGPCGSGRSSILLRLREQLGRTAAQYVDVERVATTPERFLQALRADSPFAPPAGCHFHPRCPHATDVCRIRYPEPADLGQGHRVRCHWPIVRR